MPQVVTANDFTTGGVVYLSLNGWQVDLNQAKVFDDGKSAADASLAKGNPNEVVGVYAIEVKCDGDQIKPVHIREWLRARGPSPRVLTAQPKPFIQTGDRHVSL